MNQEEFDAKGDAIVLAAERERKRTSRIMRLLTLALAFSVISTLIHFWASHDLGEDIRNTVKVQVPALEQQVATRNQTISDQQFVLQEQCIPAIVKLSEQVKKLGGTPKPVVLKPPTRSP